ncbi:MAG: hypothetical protein ACRC0F_01775 [Cetobacterium sp.]
MFRFLKECVARYGVKNGYQNVEFPKPYIQLTLVDGVHSIAKFETRECDLRAIFDSYSNNYMEAYNQLNILKESMLGDDWNNLRVCGFTIDKFNVEAIKDLSFTQNLEKTFRYQWTVRVTYRGDING